ncbi:AzlC family ABC transporter permease [Lutimaribacter marinistellae]|uniref:AzlC family ABC transporter permease n=1 Tax=Lutimaribacter marinistellae TaxID=1820329 RepID=A0ABV7TKI5_9RHOB
MSFSTPKSFFRRGARDAIPFILVAGPFGMLFGVFATEAGLDLLQTMTFSATVFAGAAQLTALQLMTEQVPTLIVLISALAVNLRVAMYSASLTPYLGQATLPQRILAAYLTVDQSYALSIIRFETDRSMSLPERMAYFIGTSAPIVPTWFGATYLGAVLGNRVPESMGLDFALPIAFLAMIGPMLRTPAHMVAAGVSCVVALMAAGIPYNLGLIVAGLAGMIAGAQAEYLIEKRKAAV